MQLEGLGLQFQTAASHRYQLHKLHDSPLRTMSMTLGKLNYAAFYIDDFMSEQRIPESDHFILAFFVESVEPGR